MSKTIIFCADGTWCGQGNQDEGKAAQTNVFKLFNSLKKDTDSDPACIAAEREISFGPTDSPVHIAKYIHGVGDCKELAEKELGGMFGAGVTARIARGYTYISRNYEAGDRIVIIGFSRGAYTARALAEFIVGQGLLKPELASDNDRYDNAAEAWFLYRRTCHAGLIAKGIDLLNHVGNIPACFKAKQLDDDSFVPVASIAAVAVWDTVGSVGIPVEGLGVDVVDYVNAALSQKVTLGLHAVSLDEQRKSFIPSLWNKAPNVTQMLFPGGHTDIGGGNVSTGLSDGPLKWFIERLAEADVGLQFGVQAFAPNASDVDSKEWEKSPWNMPMTVALRQFLDADMLVHESVYERRTSKLVTGYAPSNLPLNRQSDTKTVMAE